MTSAISPIRRIRFWYALLVLVLVVFILRLFYLQVIRHDYYKKAALTTQLKEYEIPAERGAIIAQNGEHTVSIVLNEILYTLYADPIYVKDTQLAAEKIADKIGGDQNEYKKTLEKKNTRYVVLRKRLTKDQSEAIVKLGLKGIGTREVPYRTYPQGNLASQVLGFVNDEGEGKYGIEQALNDVLEGQPGRLKAITDVSGVPLAANKDNVNISPKPGDQVVLTIDIGMQKQLEDLLKAGLQRAQSESGSALIINAKNGAIKAMANYPTFNPSEFYKEDNEKKFMNSSVSAPLEVGSIMKPFTAAAALDVGAVTKDQTYYDPSFYKIDGATVSNIEEDGGAGVRSVRDILQLSLNTGATWLLMQMGGGQINKQARERWHDYMVNHYMFGKVTGIEQGYEAPGVIPDPNDGYGLNIRYANTSFGQGMTATPLQMGSALASIINGGVYYQPRLIEKTIDSSGDEHIKQPNTVSKDVVSADVSRSIREMMEYTIQKNASLYGFKQKHEAYSIGGKTGTAEIAKPGGGYYDDVFNGMFIGYVGGDEPQYVIVTRVDRPKIQGYAGSNAAAPLFVDLTEMLLNNFGVTPKS